MSINIYIFLSHTLIVLLLFFFFFREFQPIASTPDDSFFYHQTKHQSVFSVDRD